MIPYRQLKKGAQIERNRKKKVKKNFKKSIAKLKVNCYSLREVKERRMKIKYTGLQVNCIRLHG